MTPARRTRKPGPKKSKLNRNITESEEEESSDTGSVTRCICGEAHNSGLMVQCDKCEVWQHCECIGLIQEKLPDHYYCDQCQPENHQLIKTPNGRSKRLYTPWLLNNTSTVNGPNSDHVIIAPIKRRKTTPTESPISDEITSKAELSPTAKSVEEMESLFVIEERLTRSRRNTSTSTSTTTTTSTTTSTATNTTTIKPSTAAAAAATTTTTTAIADVVEEIVVQPPKKKKRAVSSSPSPNTNNEKKPKLTHHNKSAPVPQVVYMEEFGSPVSTNNLPSPYWNYTDGKPTRESSPPARVKYPNSKMTFHEMNKRAKQILDCVSKIQVDELKKPMDQQQEQDFGLNRQRSLSTSSSSSLSSASTVPLLDDYTTCVSSPSTPIPFIPKHDESSFEILDRVNRELSKFQRKFGIVYQPQHYLRGSPIHSSNNNSNKK
ncbi:hypothetical protein HPULCUR_008245 [Helicostylum pulchrum]|uniref:PHD-type domain-containing protein n=1 Tax=Helicostylum pulchrum TaxID=562976 RepID=A0ABP9Y709_9FUNG